MIFSLLDGDRSPDIAVGRIPAQSPDQVRAVVEKTLAYEASLSDPDRTQEVLAVADGQDFSFKEDAERFLELFPANSRQTLIAPQPGERGVNRQIIDRMNRGTKLVAYFGHGSLELWGSDHLLQASDVSDMKNGAAFPIVLNLTCLTGYFIHPQKESLAEALLLQPGAGAVAVLAPSSLTLAADQSRLSLPLMDGLLHHPEWTLGDALLQARRQIPQDIPGLEEVMLTFQWFGDPALRWESSPAGEVGWR